MTYWHGGGPIQGDELLPAFVTGNYRSGDEGAETHVHITVDRTLAESYASTGPWRTAWVYEVEPVGPVEPVPVRFPGAQQLSYRCERARIVRRFTVPNAMRHKHRRSVGRFDPGLVKPIT